ncbi:MAG: HTH domain-containing protein [Roseivirga sp.]
MAEDKPRLARLAAILTLLQSKRLVTATDLAEKHQVSIRTIYRDIRTLEKSGIPIVTEEGKGYAILEGYTLPPVMFTEEEANALVTAEQIINRNKDQSLSEQYQSAVTKLKAVLRHSQKEKVELLENRLQIRTNPKALKTSSFLIQLQSTITNYQVISMQYTALDGQSSEREIEPFALFSTQENWLLVAWCRLRNDFRAFRLDCIQEIELMGSNFEPHQLTLSEYFEQCREKQQHP